MQQCEEMEMVYEKYEYTDYDYEGLKCLLQTLVGLLQYKPDERISIQEAMSYIDWIDHRAETEEAEADEVETEDVETEEARTEKSETEK